MIKKEKAFCEICDDDVEFDIIEEKRDAKIRGIRITYTFYKATCKNCGEQVFPVSLSKKNQISMYDAYKKEAGLLTSEDIVNIRQERKLTQTQLAKLMGCGEKTIARYENGAIQDRVFDNFLRLIGNDEVYSISYGSSDKQNFYSEVISIGNSKFTKLVNMSNDNNIYSPAPKSQHLFAFNGGYVK